jgi:Tol biopolymer transport system component
MNLIRQGDKKVTLGILLVILFCVSCCIFVWLWDLQSIPPGPELTGLQPTQGKLVFSRGGCLWTVNTDGTSLRELHCVIGIEADDPAWSPDGSKILFARRGSSSGVIKVMNEDGSDPTTLMKGFRSTGAPRWSHDGTWIAFSATDENNFTNIYAMTSDGSTLRNLTVDCNYCDWPSWSLDDSAIAFVSSEDWLTHTINMLDLYADLKPVQIASFQGGISHLSWSPDGREILFDWRPRGSEQRSDVYAINNDGSNLKKLTTNKSEYNGEPTWSPDGSQIAFVAYYPRSSRLSRWINFLDPPAPGEGIYIMNRDGTGLAQATPNNLREVGSPDWWAPPQ